MTSYVLAPTDVELTVCGPTGFGWSRLGFQRRTTAPDANLRGRPCGTHPYGVASEEVQTLATRTRAITVRADGVAEQPSEHPEVFHDEVVTRPLRPSSVNEAVMGFELNR